MQKMGSFAREGEPKEPLLGRMEAAMSPEEGSYAAAGIETALMSGTDDHGFQLLRMLAESRYPNTVSRLLRVTAY